MMMFRKAQSFHLQSSPLWKRQKDHGHANHTASPVRSMLILLCASTGSIATAIIVHEQTVQGPKSQAPPFSFDQQVVGQLTKE
jgi:hypothetical protein